MGEVAVQDTCLREVAVQDTCLGEVAVQDTCLREVAVQETCLGEVAVQDTCLREVAVQETCLGEVAVQDTCLGAVAVRDTSLREVADWMVLCLGHVVLHFGDAVDTVHYLREAVLEAVDTAWLLYHRQHILTNIHSYKRQVYHMYTVYHM